MFLSPFCTIRLPVKPQGFWIIIAISFLSTRAAFSQCGCTTELVSCSGGAYVMLTSTYKGSCTANDGTVGHYYAYVLEIRNRSSTAAPNNSVTFSLKGEVLPSIPCVHLTDQTNLGTSYSFTIPAGTVQPYELKRHRFALMYRKPIDNDLQIEWAERLAKSFCP
jgi:hypothetical protein